MDDKRLKKICKLGQGVKTCRYATVGNKGFECARGTNLERVIDRKVERGEFSAESINCDGYPEKEEK